MIEFLDMKKQWAKVRAGFSGGKLYKSIPPQPARRFVDGRDPLTEQAQMFQKPTLPVFGGKTFSQRKK